MTTIAKGLTKTSLVFIFALTITLISATKVSAANKSIEISTAIASDDPYVSLIGNKVSELGTELKAQLNITTTQIDSTEINETAGPWVYTWRLNIPDLCEGAVTESIRVVAVSETENESPLSGIFLALYGGSENLEFRDGFTINNGYGSALDWFPVPYPTPAIERGIGDGENYFPDGLGFNGLLDATWDVSDYSPGENLGIFVQHWIADGSTTIAQTTIQSVTLTYDDSGCSQPSTTLTTNLPKTNKASYLVLPSSTSNASFTATPANTVPTDSNGQYSYPTDLVSFQFDTESPGDTETITLYFDLPGDPSTYTARKYNDITKEFSSIPNASITREDYNNTNMLKLTYQITDGGTLDQDNTVNGTIVDPVGLATTTGTPDTGIQQYWLLNLK